MENSQKIKKSGTVFVSGIFNVLHPGHFRFLNFASNLGEKLIVGVLSDRLAPEATVDEKERLEFVSALSFVHEAVLLDHSPAELIAERKPDIVVKGWEFHDKENPEREALKEYGGRLIFSSGDIKMSASHAESDERYETAAIRTIFKPVEFMERRQFSMKSLQKLLNKYDSLNVCVLGDIIVDQYINCEAVGMSREDPTIVVRPAESNFYLGAAGIVAAHARGLGANVHFISVCGNDEAGKYSQERLHKYGVESYVIEDDSRPTTQKTRYRAAGKTLLRVNDYSNHPISDEIAQKILDKLKELIPQINVIIFSDFSYGALPQDMVDQIIELANENNIIIAADSQISSQTGNVARFKNVSLITPTEHEARHSINNYSDGLVRLSDKIREITRSENVVVTLAGEGLLVTTLDENGDMTNDRLPALQSVPVDPAGAGDALLVTAAMGLAAGGTIWESVYLGSLASAVQVSRVGNIPLQYGELFEVLEQ